MATIYHGEPDGVMLHKDGSAEALYYVAGGRV